MARILFLQSQHFSYLSAKIEIQKQGSWQITRTDVLERDCYMTRSTRRYDSANVTFLRHGKQMKLQCCTNKNQLKESSAVVNRSQLKIRKESQTTLFWDTDHIIFKRHRIRPFKNTSWNIYSVSENRCGS